MTMRDWAQLQSALISAMALAGCGASGVPLYKGPQKSNAEVALLITGQGLVYEQIYASDASIACGGPPTAECPAQASLLPGRYRMIARPARWPRSPRRWVIDVDLAAAHSYEVRTIARQSGVSSGSTGPDISDSYSTAVAIVDVESGKAVAAGVPEQESAPLPPGTPMAHDPKGPRCPPHMPATTCTPLPPAWFSKGEHQLEL
jgi:hypothetical protein